MVGHPPGAGAGAGVSITGRGGDRLRDPVFWTDIVQLVKTVVAATLAWVLATRMLGLEQPFLAPWAALLVVNTTVFKTFNQGGRQVAATVLGVVVASAIGQTMGLDTLSLAIVLAAGLALGSWRWMEGQETTVAATALVVLTAGASGDDMILLARLADTAIGIGVGILVNLMVWPPLRRRTAISAMNGIDDAIGVLLVEIADGIEAGPDDELVESWVERTRDLDRDLDEAWALVRQARESARLNPRGSAKAWRDPSEWQGLLRRMEQAVAECRSLARTLGLSLSSGREWHPQFRNQFAGVLRRSGYAIEEADPQPLEAARATLDDLVAELSDAGLDPQLWPEYGGVLINLRNVLAAMDEVARVNPLGQPPLPLPARRRHSAG